MAIQPRQLNSTAFLLLSAFTIQLSYGQEARPQSARVARLEKEARQQAKQPGAPQEALMTLIELKDRAPGVPQDLLSVKVCMPLTDVSTICGTCDLEKLTQNAAGI